MFEFPFITEGAPLGPTASGYWSYMEDRMTTLMEYASKLDAAGWTVGFTARGLGVMWPDFPFAYYTDTQIRNWLDRLGIDELPVNGRSVSADEIGDLCKRVRDCLWFDRHAAVESKLLAKEDMSKDEMLHAIRDTLPELTRIRNDRSDEAFYVPCQVLDSYQRGVLEGQLRALAWVLGDQILGKGDVVEQYDKEKKERTERHKKWLGTDDDDSVEETVPNDTSEVGMAVGV
jgi:hypothetical protein